MRIAVIYSGVVTMLSLLLTLLFWYTHESSHLQVENNEYLLYFFLSEGTTTL